MSNETFSAAIFIVTSILVAVVLANALFPAVVKSVQSSELSSDSLTGQLNTQLSLSETVFYNSGDDSHLFFYLKNGDKNGRKPTGQRYNSAVLMLTLCFRLATAWHPSHNLLLLYKQNSFTV